MTPTRWLSADEPRAWRALRTFGTPLAAALNRQLLSDSALSMADYEVLVVLSESDAGVLRAGVLGRATGWEKSRLSHHIKRMEARRLVERQNCVTDVLTPDQLAILAEAGEAVEARLTADNCRAAAGDDGNCELAEESQAG